MPVKIEPAIVEELLAMDLTIWEAKHPRIPFTNKAGKQSTKEDKSWVVVSLAGPGVEEARAGAQTLRQAVDAALMHAGLADRVPGLRGAMLRLEMEMWRLGRLLVEERYEDDIPF